MALQTRSTVFAIKRETTEGTPVSPTANTDFIALHDGFDVSPEFEVLENAELQSSIGQTKSTLGFENPTASFDHYMRHSGVEGQAPNYGLLIEALLGATSTNSTERTTDAGSTTSVIELTAGGDDFERGKALLIKDSTSTNGYAVRNVASVATNSITLAQNVGTAPAAGINTGKCINYSVANSGHPTFSFWTYRSNGGAIELLSGARAVSLGISASAGENITGSFSVEGIEYSYDPMEVTASNKYLNFTDSGPTTFEIAITADMYKDPYELASAIETAMNGTAAVDEYTVTYSDTDRKFTFTSDGTAFTILWKTGTNGSDNADNHIGTLLGFSDTADDTGALTYTADTALSWATTLTPSYDSADPLVAKNQQIMIGTSTEVACFHPKSVDISIDNTKVDELDICAASGKSGTLFTGRTVTVDVVAHLTTGQALEFKRFRNNDEIIFTYNSGNKSGGNWVPGTVVNYHMPTAKISNFQLTDDDGLVSLEMTVQAFVSSGQGEFYINYL